MTMFPQEAETLRLEVEELKGSIEKAKEEVTATETNINELQMKVSYHKIKQKL